MCSGMSSASARVRESLGLHVHPLLRADNQLGICKSIPLIRSIADLTLLSQCSGETPDGKDFEAFIGAEKTEEFKQLFTSWIYKIYRVYLFTVHWYHHLSVHCASDV